LSLISDASPQQKSFRDLFVEALDAYRSATDDNESWETYWNAIESVSTYGQDAFDVASRFAQTQDPVRHHVAVDAMARIAFHHEDLRAPIAQIVLGCVGKIPELGFVLSAVNALGQTRSRQAVPFLLECLDSQHLDLRISAAIALGECADTSSEALSALTKASTDSNDQVRRWATYAIASNGRLIDTDTTNLLAARLFDQDDDVRNEAIFGLGLREDERAIAPLKQLVEVSDSLRPDLKELAARMDLL